VDRKEIDMYKSVRTICTSSKLLVLEHSEE